MQGKKFREGLVLKAIIELILSKTFRYEFYRVSLKTA